MFTHHLLPSENQNAFARSPSAYYFLEITSFLYPHFQRAINLSTGNLLIILFLLTKFEAPS